MPYNLRVDAYHSQDALGEIQHLIDIASNSKEEFDYTLLYLKKKLVDIGMTIKKKRQNLSDYLVNKGIDWSKYPVFNKVFADDVFQDTVAPENIGLVDVEKAMRKNIPDEMIKLLEEKLGPYNASIDVIHVKIDILMKLRLEKAYIERKMQDIALAKSDYQANEEKYGAIYLSIRKDLEDAINLHKNLGDFLFMFVNTPQTLTSAHYAKLNDNQTDMLCSMYVGKKKNIKTQADRIQENYEDVSRYNGIGDAVKPENVVSDMQSISVYFGPVGTDSLPAQYVDAYQKKRDVVSKLDTLMKSVAVYIGNIKKVLDQLRGNTGIGNKELDGLYSNVVEIVKSPVNARRIEQVNITEITNINQRNLSDTKTSADGLKNFLQRGVDKINTKLTQFQKDQAVKVSINMGYPVTDVKDRNQSLEDNVREKVRKKFGRIPFCDEVEMPSPYGGTMFVKKSDVKVTTDPVTGQETYKLLTEVSGNILLKVALSQP